MIALSVLIREAASRKGYANVKPKQLETVLEFGKGKDVFVSLPTGFGKTLIYVRCITQCASRQPVL